MLKDHIPDLLFDIFGLISDWNLCQTRKIDKCECEDIRRVNAEMDWEWRDSEVRCRLEVGIPDNLISDLIEVVEFLAGQVQDLAPLIDISVYIVSGLDGFVLFGFGSVRALFWRRSVDEL